MPEAMLPPTSAEGRVERRAATSLRKIAAYVLIVVSFLAWLLIAALPWLELSMGQAAAAASALIVGGEVTFYLGVLLLGREAWERIKGLFVAWQKRPG